VKLPNAENAIITQDKLTEYLLSPSHLIGKWKARFFLSIGFSKTKTDDLKSALLHVAKSGEVTNRQTTDFGIKYVVDGVIRGPSGKTANVRTVWVQEQGQDQPRLVTAYPVQQIGENA
jgi:hypothetical protein